MAERGGPSKAAMRSTLLGMALAVLLAGCVSAHGRAMDAGDRAFAAGSWDAAVAAYAEAVRLDPEDPAARAGLARAREARIAEVTRTIDGLAAAGRLLPALRTAAGLVAVEPQHPEATRRFDSLAAQVLDAADAAREGDLERAIELADAVLEVARVRAVDVERARRIAGEARAALTERTVTEAEAAIASRWFGHATLLVAALEVWGVTDPRATAIATTARSALREDTTWVVGVRPTEADAERGGLGAEVDAARLQSSLDPGYAIRLVPASPGASPGAVSGAPGAAATTPGTVIGLAVRGVPPVRTTGRTEGSCAWICGTTTTPNPRVASLRASIEVGQDAVRRAERRVDERGRERRAGERAVEDARRAERAAEAEAEAARRDLSGCRTASSGVEPADRRCQAEESAVQRAQRAVEETERAERDAEGALARARAEEEAAVRARADERNALELATQALASTPATIEVERTCHERYGVEEGSVAAEVVVRLGIEEGERRVEETLTGRFAVSDRAHGARPGTCRELAVPDPLDLPNDEVALRSGLERALVQVRHALVKRDDARRTEMLVAARAHAAAGRELDAVEQRARWIAGATQPEGQVATSEAATELSRATGLPPIAVVRAIRR